MAQQAAYTGTGRRKDSVARVRLVPGNGKITVNGKDIDQYIPFPNLVKDLKQPLTLTETEGQYDIHVNVNGVSQVKLELSVLVSLVLFLKLTQTSVVHLRRQVS